MVAVVVVCDRVATHSPKFCRVFVYVTCTYTQSIVARSTRSRPSRLSRGLELLKYICIAIPAFENRVNGYVSLSLDPLFRGSARRLLKYLRCTAVVFGSGIRR